MGILTTVLSSHLRTPHLILRNIKWRMPRTISDQQVVFVVGAPRSGTTLLQRVLASHSALFSIEGETGIFSARNYFTRTHFRLSAEDTQSLFDRSSDIVDFFANGVMLLKERRGEGTFVEKTPQHVRHLAFLLKHFPRAKFVHVIRDGRDCFCSAQGHPNIPQRSSVSTFAKYWKSCIKSARRESTSDRIFTLKYEDFTADASGWLDRIMAFLGKEAEADQLNPARIGDDQRSAAKHFKRLTAPISNATVERWRTELTPEQVAAFDRIAGTELQLHGYAVGGA
jgi:hypothetical protein